MNNDLTNRNYYLKHTMKKGFFAFIAACICFAYSAQAQGKLGYTNVDYILNYMPEVKGVDSELKAYKTQIENSLKSKTEDLQKKFEDYQKKGATMAESVRADKEKELQGLKQSLDEFAVNAENDLRAKEAKLLKPLYDKIQKAVEKVAKENGYTYVFNSTALLYGPVDEGDVSNLIFKEMGITPPAKDGADIGAGSTTTPPKTETPKPATGGKKK